MEQPDAWEPVVEQALTGDARAFADLFRMLGSPATFADAEWSTPTA